MKIAYILISSENDYYAEQLLVSLYSLKLHNPDCNPVILTDRDTVINLKGRLKRINEFADEIIEIKLPEGMTGKEKSRFIKTSMLKYIDGDFLFIDVDTLIMKSLQEIVTYNCNIGAVLDCHTSATGNGQMLNCLKLKKIKNWVCFNYFNSGVVWVKDNEATRKFFNDWHEIWYKDWKNYQIVIDQFAFAQANLNNKNIVEEIPGQYNCQLTKCYYKFLLNAKIIHYMSDVPQNNDFPFKNIEILKKVRENGITEGIKDMISDPLTFFLEKSIILSGNDLKIYNSPTVILGRKLSRDYPWINKGIRFLYRLIGYKI